MRILVASLALSLALACNQDPLGGPCSEKEDDVYKIMEPKDGDNFISQSPAAFLNCESFVCLSTNGSKPYCTKRCGSSSECGNGNGIEMECKVVTEFGALACRVPSHDWCADGSDEEDLCCERDPDTQGVIDPATYCAAKDGQVPHDPAAQPIGG